MYNKALILAVVLTGLAGCGKKEEAAAPAAAATPAATAPAAVADAPATAGLPQVCEAYLARAKACFDKSNPQVAAAFQQGVDQAKAQWAAMDDKAALEAGCTAANTQFTQVVASLKCE